MNKMLADEGGFIAQQYIGFFFKYSTVYTIN